jgi:putative heme-binding domain-containing protein
MGDKGLVPALLGAAGEPSDRVLEHSLTFALIEIGDPRGTARGLASRNARTRRAAMIVLDQMEGGTLGPGDVAPALAAAEPEVRETAAWIAGRHPEWGEALVGPVRDRLEAKGLSPADRARLAGQLARSEPIQAMLDERLRDPSSPKEARLTVLRAMAASGLRAVPDAWNAGLAQVLTGDDLELTRQAIATVRSLQTPRTGAKALAPALLRVASRESAPAEVRLEALAAVPGGLTEVSPELFAFLTAELAPERPVPARGAAADVLSKAKLEPGQLAALTGSIKAAGPLELDRLLSAFERTDREDVGLKLVSALEQSPARTTLRVEMLRPRLAKYSASVRRKAEGLYAALSVDAASQKARLEGLLATITGGDVRRGQAVFNNPKAACVACHAIGYVGGNVGPDLTHIGKVRTERDLLESIAFPSASFVRSYEPLTVATRDGKVYNGVPRTQTPGEVVLATGPDQEARIARDEIEEIRPGTVSVMPAGLDQQLSPRELADLVAFLKACQ